MNPAVRFGEAGGAGGGQEGSNESQGCLHDVRVHTLALRYLQMLYWAHLGEA